LKLAGPYENRKQLRAAYKAGTLDLNNPSTSAAAIAAAAPVRRRRLVNTTAPRATSSNPSTASDATEMDAAFYDVDDNSVRCRNVICAPLPLYSLFFNLLFLAPIFSFFFFSFRMTTTYQKSIAKKKTSTF